MKVHLAGFVVALFITGIAHAETISLNTATGTITGLLLEGGGTPNVGVIFFHGRGASPNGDVVGQLRQSLNADGYTTLSIDNPVPATGGTTFAEYLADEISIGNQVNDYFNTAVNELVARNSQIDTIVVGGLSLGSRFATATAAALNQGLFSLNPNVTLGGLLGVGMYSTSTTTVYNTIQNLGLISPDIPVLDLFGDLDSVAANFASDRFNAFPGADALYTQVALGCPDFNSSTFYTRRGGSAIVYDEDTCHQLRNAFPTASDALNGTNVSVILRGSADAPLESNVSNWFAANVPLTPIPIPPTVWLFGSGLLGLVGMARRKKAA